MHITLATCQQYPALSASDALLADELRRRGHVVEATSWNSSEGSRAAASDRVVLRSTWDYHHDVERYKNWLHHVDGADHRLVNALPLVLWNLSKTYLLDLARLGAPVPGLVLVDSHPTLMPEWARAGRPVVVKPAIGASGTGVELVAPGELDAVLARSSIDDQLIVQEFVEDVGAGEWALVFFGGEFSHGFSEFQLPASSE